MSVDQLKALVVDAFPLSKRRAELWKNFIQLLDKFKQIGLSGDIWVDGSFLTEKMDPSDVDFILDIPVNAYYNPTAEQADMLERLSRREFRKPERLHTFVIFSAPVMHKEYGISQRVHDQWKKDWGFSYVKKDPKGIAVIMVTP